MRWGTYVLRRFAAALALSGVLVHASLLPWHTVSQFLASVAAKELAADLMLICRGEGRPSHAGQPGDSPPIAPAGPQSHCPICKGLVAFHNAVLGKVDLGLLDRPTAAFERSPSLLSLASPIGLLHAAEAQPTPLRLNV